MQKNEKNYNCLSKLSMDVLGDNDDVKKINASCIELKERLIKKNICYNKFMDDEAEVIIKRGYELENFLCLGDANIMVYMELFQKAIVDKNFDYLLFSEKALLLNIKKLNLPSTLLIGENEKISNLLHIYDQDMNYENDDQFRKLILTSYNILMHVNCKSRIFGNEFLGSIAKGLQIEKSTKKINEYKMYKILLEEYKLLQEECIMLLNSSKEEKNMSYLRK